MRSIVLPGHRRELPGVSGGSREGLGDRDAHARGSARWIGSGRRRPRTKTVGAGTRMILDRPGHEDERWPHASGGTRLEHDRRHGDRPPQRQAAAVTLQCRCLATDVSSMTTDIAAADFGRWKTLQANVDDRQYSAARNDRRLRRGITAIRPCDLTPWVNAGPTSPLHGRDRGRRHLDWSKDPDNQGCAVYAANRESRRAALVPPWPVANGGDTDRTLVCACLRHGRSCGATISAATTPHPEAPPDSCGWLQSRARPSI